MPTIPTLAPPAPVPAASDGPAYPQWLRDAARQARTFRDRLCQPFLRDAAHRRLARLAGDGPVLFVCFGNICRSPFAAGLARGAMGLRAVESAGFARPGRLSPAEAVSAASQWGVDLSSHLSRQLDARMVADAALIIVMEPVQSQMLRSRFPVRSERVLMLGDLDPRPSPTRLIVDPWGKAESEFVACYARIERCLDALLPQMAMAEAS